MIFRIILLCIQLLLQVTFSQNECQSKYLTDFEINSLVKLHNYYRSQVAMGIVENQPPARNINILSYDGGRYKSQNLLAQK